MSEVPTVAEPTAITRESLKSGVLQRMIVAADPTAEVLSFEALAESRRAILATEQAAGGDVWVFGYGSLIWNPAFHFVERRTGLIHGWHRRFCLWTELGRGTPDRPGLVLGLDRGGTCRGVVFRIAAAAVEEELDLIWRREMVTASYTPRWVTAATPEGPVRAIAFTINRTQPRYAGRLSEEETARVLALACGQLGSCQEYFRSTLDHLVALGIRDHGLEALRRRIAAIGLG
ncbi:gamma-glutamylcyclotransferase [Inquilinus sp. OTU3971]|uniref:gamma-glutamylcyclotransferase n=1 Tax=Inquilinus sp. OTU3971 TaxID=3043855 RepID=UPI00313BEBDD